MIEDQPRLSLDIGRGTEFRDGLRGALESLRDELGSEALEHLGVLIGALSRTQASQFEVREGLELRLWVFPDTVRIELDPCDGVGFGMPKHLCDRWGIEVAEDGRSLAWFEIARESEPAVLSAAGG